MSESERRRIVLCIGPKCHARGDVDAFYERLRACLGYPNPLSRAPLKWEAANCLDQCDHGPNLVLHPAGHWWHHLDDAQLEAFIAQEIEGG